MLINTLNRVDQLPSQAVKTASSGENLFAAVLNQLLMEQELQSTVKPTSNSYSPTVGNTVDKQSFPVSSDNSLRFKAIDPEKINKVLGGKLKGMGEVFVRAGKQFNIDPALLAAVAQHETGNGKSRAANEKNNIAGMMGINGLKSYPSIEDSIMDMARNLSKNYLGAGLSSIAEIGGKYAPVGADNDPTGLNNYWVTGVTKYFDQLKV